VTIFGDNGRVIGVLFVAAIAVSTSLLFRYTWISALTLVAISQLPEMMPQMTDAGP
jgi:hypothetical protein